MSATIAHAPPPPRAHEEGGEADDIDVAVRQACATLRETAKAMDHAREVLSAEPAPPLPIDIDP